jgi:hypothetical protein
MTPPSGQQLYWDFGVRMDGLPNTNGHNLSFDTLTVGAGSYDTNNGGSGVTANLNDSGPIGLTASNSIFSDSLNAGNVTTQSNAPTSVNNVIVPAGQTPVIGQYCNGARIPPEQCSAGQGANDPGMCKGYFTPAGQSETVGVSPVFQFTGIAATATVDEGNNWINLTYGPLSLSRPPTNGSTTTASAEPTVASAAVGIAQGAYSITADSAAVGAGNAAAPGTPNHDFYGQTRPTTGVSIGAVELIPLPPTLTDIAPPSGAQGADVTVVLSGSNFTQGSNVVITGGGINGTGINQYGAVFTPTSITTHFVIDSAATLGARSVTVGTAGGVTAALTFTVTAKAPVPTLTSIAPNSGTRGTAVPVTLTGTGLSGATAVTVSGGNVTVNNITVVNDSTVSATFTITTGANLSGRNVTITTLGGTSNAVTFTVTAPPRPTLTSSAPNTGVRGTAVAVTLTGTHLTGATGVTVNGGGVNVSGLTVVNDTTVKATFTITAGATLSTRNVTVTTPAGTSANASLFTVQGARLTSISPNVGAHNTSVPVTLTGANLGGATAVNVSGGGITVNGFTKVNATTVKANFAIANGAAHTGRNVTVPTSIGTTNAVTFTVN